jgi:hypothetical protein
MIYAPTVELQELAHGLWRWTAPHPEWEPPKEEDDPADWPQDVGCVAYAAARRLTLIDPLVAEGDSAEIDRLAESAERVAILTTLPFHGRSGSELVERYGASTSTPAEIEAIEIAGAGETMFWIAEHRALVPGDRILGDHPPGLRMCPESWLRYLGGYTRADLRNALRQALLGLPVELVLVSHGEPVLSEARRELEQALA